ncbi:MAG: hypothetical protein AB2551_12555 [Candidatus Thiodiazotropha sp.]
MSDEKDTSLTDLEREALIYKIAKDAQSQFWDRLKRPLIPGITIVAVVFGVVGFSLNSFVSEKVSTIATDEVSKLIKSEFDLQKSLAKSTYDSAVAELTKSNKAAADVNEKQNELLGELSVQRQKIRDEIKTIESDLSKQVDDTNITVSNLNTKLRDLEQQAIALKSFESINILDLTEKVKQIESLVGNSDTSIFRRVSAIEDEQEARGKRLDLLDTGNNQLSVGAQRLAQASCVAIGPSTWVFAVPRDCNNREKSCSQICAEISESQAGQLRCFNSLHIYENGPANSLDQIGYKMYRYDGCGGGCGPNYCCCASGKG